MLEKKSLWNTEIMAQALVDSVRKLDPRGMVKNPVMFVVEVGAVLTTALLIDNTINHRAGFGFNLQITLWLWVTVLFANFAEAMAEGRGKAQADTLRKAKGETVANRYTADGGFEEIASGLLRLGDVIYVEANHYIAGDGEVIEGVASVDESAITGESAPVIREAGGDRSAVTGGTKVSRTGSRYASPPTPAKPFWTA
jgi:K+-transporting ATPase ATPase B chain